MPIKADYLGMSLSIDDLDGENLAYFKHCAEHNFHLQACEDCKLLRYPPTTACPWCMSRQAKWVPVEGKGAVHSYTRGASRHPAGVQGAHALPDPAGRPRHPEGQADASTRPCAWSATWRRPTASSRRRRWCKKVGIGTRVRMVFADVAPGLALAAVDHRRGRQAARQALALPAGVTQALQLIRPRQGRAGASRPDARPT